MGIKKEVHSVYEEDIRKYFADSQYIILNSVRGCSKSYAVKKYVLKNNIESNEEFVFLRRKYKEIKDMKVVKQFTDMDIKDISHNEFDSIDVYRRGIYFASTNEKGEKIRKKLCGYVYCLSEFESDKSEQLPNVTSIMYEEYCTNEYYLENEPHLLQEFVSSVFRNRKGQVFMLGNKLNIFNPYFSDWGLRNAQIQKIGTIDTYRKTDLDGNEIIISVWHIKKREKASGMFFGTAARSIDGDEFYIEKQPRLPDKIENYDTAYTVIVIVDEVSFLLRFLQHKEDSTRCVWYVEPKTTEVHRNDDRIVSNILSDSIYATQGFYPLTEAENNIFKYLRQGKIAYSSDGCGTNFKNALKQLNM